MQYIVEGGGWIAPRAAVMPLPDIESETNLNPALWGLQLPKGSGEPIKAISNIDKSYRNSSPLDKMAAIHRQPFYMHFHGWNCLYLY